MGGTAFGFTADRFTTVEFNEVATVIATSLVDHSDKFEKMPQPILSYRQKETHGDMDLVYSGNPDILMEILYENNIITDHKRNGPVTSMLFPYGGRKFQLDFINVSPESHNFAFNYFCWNDLGNLIGRLAHRIGLKFAFTGLWYVCRDKNNTKILGEILLTNDFDAALTYLDLNAARFHQGFDSLEEIFEFVVESKYYDYESVDIERRNNVARTRDKKRSTYNAYLKWLKKQGLDCYNLALPPKYTFLRQHIERFPHLGAKINELEEKERRNMTIKTKFNGDIVSEVTGLTGKELGQFMSHCKNQTWFQLVEDLTEVEIRHLINNEFTSCR